MVSWKTASTTNAPGKNLLFLSLFQFHFLNRKDEMPHPVPLLRFKILTSYEKHD